MILIGILCIGLALYALFGAIRLVMESRGYDWTYIKLILKWMGLR